MLLSKRSVLISRWQTAIVSCVPATQFGPATRLAFLQTCCRTSREEFNLSGS
jgi:hypothetical protein